MAIPSELNKAFEGSGISRATKQKERMQTYKIEEEHKEDGMKKSKKKGEKKGDKKGKDGFTRKGSDAKKHGSDSSDEDNKKAKRKKIMELSEDNEIDSNSHD